jgi:hypothetical protein
MKWLINNHWPHKQHLGLGKFCLMADQTFVRMGMISSFCMENNYILCNSASSLLQIKEFAKLGRIRGFAHGITALVFMTAMSGEYALSPSFSFNPFV